MNRSIPFAQVVFDETQMMPLTDMPTFDHQDVMWMRPIKLTLDLGRRW